MYKGELSCKQLLDQTRKVMKRRRGWFGRVHDEDRLSGRISVSTEDPLQLQWDENEYLLQKGNIVWGALVQANQVLFRHGYENAPGEIVISTDPHFDDNPDELLKVAHAVSGLKGTQPSDPQVRAIADEITGEMARAFGKPVPEAITRKVTAGKGVRRHSMQFDRRHFPEGVIGQHLFPVLTHEQCKSVCFLPATCWGPDLQAFWQLSDHLRAELTFEKQQRDLQRKRLPIIQITSAAVAKLREHLAATKFTELIIRVGMDSGVYKLGYLNRSNISPDDRTIQQDDVLIVISEPEVDALWGTELDYARHGDMEGFKFNEYEV